MFTREKIVDLFLDIFMASEGKRVHEKHAKFELPQSNKHNFRGNYHNLMVNTELLYIVGCYVVLILKRKE